MNCKQRGDPLRFDKARLYSIKFSEISKGGTLYYVLNKARIKFGEINKGGDPLRFWAKPDKIQRNAKGGPFTIWAKSIKNSSKCKGGTLCVLNKVRIQRIQQRGDPLRFWTNPDKIQRNAKGGPFTICDKSVFSKGGTLYVFEQSQIKFSERQRGDPLLILTVS